MKTPKRGQQLTIENTLHSLTPFTIDHRSTTPNHS